MTRFQPRLQADEVLETRALMANAAAVSLTDFSGFVFQDLNNNGTVDAGEGVSNARVNVYFRSAPGAAENPNVISFDTTDANGFYLVSPPPGSPIRPDGAGQNVPVFAEGFYRVELVPPVGLTSLNPEINSPIDPNDPNAPTIIPNQVINACSGTDRADPFRVDFPLVVTGDTQNASLSGFKYFDANLNNTFDDADYGISTITMLLTGTTDAGQPIQRTTVTDFDGFYEFTNLPAGTYTITEQRPRLFLPGVAQPGNLGGQAVVVNNPQTGGLNNAIASIAVDVGDVGVNYNISNRARPECKLYCLSTRARAIQLLQTRRDLDPTRFDATHPVVGQFLANTRNVIPPALLRARGPLIARFLPTLVNGSVNA